jgi:aspartyl-tRNA(Asn)/glutamyl-tRNA(Gln) amidotransferase subunit A
VWALENVVLAWEPEARLTDILLLSVSEIADQFRSRALSPMELLNLTLERAETVQARLNPFRMIDREGARRSAEASERRWARGEPLSLLDGVPVSIKDNQAIAGQPRTSGSLANEHLPPMTEDAPHVARLRQAGAIFYARTNMPDNAWKAVCDSPLSGITRNPWNSELTPGGSSGGAAVAVATGCGPIATGSDGGGSIRIPAAFTGIYGIKPTTGRIPGITEAPDISAVGPLSRTVADAALALSVMCRPDASDPLSAALVVPDFVAEMKRGVHQRGDKPLKVAVSSTCGFEGADVSPLIDASRLDALESAARALAAAGAIVEYAEPPAHHIRRAYVTVCEVAFGAVVAGMPAERIALLDPGLDETARRGMMTSAVIERQAHLERVRLMQAFIRFLTKYDLLLTPCVPIAPFIAGDNINTPDEKTYPEWYDWTPYTWVFNATKMPAASCPWGLDAAGLPQAVQLVARHFREDLVLRGSAVLESAMPAQRPADGLWDNLQSIGR